MTDKTNVPLTYEEISCLMTAIVPGDDEGGEPIEKELTPLERVVLKKLVDAAEAIIARDYPQEDEDLDAADEVPD